MLLLVQAAAIAPPSEASRDTLAAGSMDTTAAAVYHVLVSGTNAAPKPEAPSLWSTLVPPAGIGSTILHVAFVAALIALLLALATALLLATWQMARTFHHLRWSVPPRRLQNVELGPQGAKFGWDANALQDDERDRQIADLRERLDILADRHNRLAENQEATADSIQVLTEHLLR